MARRTNKQIRAKEYKLKGFKKHVCPKCNDTFWGHNSLVEPKCKTCATNDFIYSMRKYGDK